MGAANLPAVLRTALSVPGRAELLLLIPQFSTGLGQVTPGPLGPRPILSKGSLLEQRKRRLSRHNAPGSYAERSGQS